MYNQKIEIQSDEHTVTLEIIERDDGVVFNRSVTVPNAEAIDGTKETEHLSAFLEHDQAMLLLSMLSNVYNGVGEIVTSIDGESFADYV